MPMVIKKPILLIWHQYYLTTRRTSHTGVVQRKSETCHLNITPKKYWTMMSTASTNGGESMQFIFGLVSYILILYGMEQRSVLTLLLAPLSIAMLVFHYKGYKIASVLLMLLQGVLTAFMMYLRLQGYVQSDYLLYLSGLSILMLASMTVELFIQPRRKVEA